MICINPFNDLPNRYVETIEKVRRKEEGGTQTGQSRVVGLGAKVGLGARGMLIGIHRSLSEPIGIYRRSSALFGFVLIDSDKF